jgi:Holliday junction resolvase RusA-like endonuclease
MFTKFLKNSNKIEFKVLGKPPQKSEWGGDNASLVIKLRKAALEAREKTGLTKCITSPVRLSLVVNVPNIDDRNYVQKGDHDEKRFIGDLDSLIAGVCDYLSRAPEEPGRNNFKPSVLFDSEPEVGPTISLIIQDDSQVKIIHAEKIVSDELSYVVKIESL